MTVAQAPTQLNSEASSPRRLPIAISFRIEPLRFLLKLAFLAAALAASAIVVATARTFTMMCTSEIAIGLLIAHATELAHQTLHKTATGVARWDQRLGRVLGWMSGTSFWYYTFFHLWHHRHNGTEMDAESFGYAYAAMHSPKRFVRVIAFARHLSMASHYRTLIERTWLALRGRLVDVLLRSTPAMKPVIARRIAQDYIVLAVIVGAAVVASLVLRTALLIYIWLIPLLVVWGPAHALIELPEHWGCDRPEANALRNTRSIRAGWFAQWFTNYNCNHVGHHHDMSVPMERLPEYEAELMRRGFFQHYDESYAMFYCAFLRHIFLRSPRRPRASVETAVSEGHTALSGNR